MHVLKSDQLKERAFEISNEFNSIKEDEFISKLSDNLKFEYIKCHKTNLHFLINIVSKNEGKI